MAQMLRPAGAPNTATQNLYEMQLDADVQAGSSMKEHRHDPDLCVAAYVKQTAPQQKKHVYTTKLLHCSLLPLTYCVRGHIHVLQELLVYRRRAACCSTNPSSVRECVRGVETQHPPTTTGL
jgi:hypothetical protein